MHPWLRHRKLADKPKESVHDILNESEAMDVKIRMAKTAKIFPTVSVVF
jgi:hypothetical protein